MMTIIIIIVTIKRRTNRFRERIRNPRSYLPLPLPLLLPNFLLFGYRERETRRTIATLGARHFYLFRIFHRRSKFISSSHKLQSLGRLASDRRLSACFVGENAAGLNGGRNVDGICRERAERGEGVMFLKDCTKGERRKNGEKKKEQGDDEKRPWMGNQARLRREGCIRAMECSSRASGDRQVSRKCVLMRGFSTPFSPIREEVF